MTAPVAEDLRFTPLEEIKALIDLLAELDIPPLHLAIDAHRPTDPRADIRLWVQTRTQFEAVCKALGAKTTEARWDPAGQRSFTAVVDTDNRKLLVSCVSLQHHADWQPKGGVA